MILKNTTFNHDANDLDMAVNLPEQTVIRTRERIVFQCISNAIQVTEIYQDPDLAPRSMKTCSGDLETLLKNITDEGEYELTLLMFSFFQNLSLQAYQAHRALEDDSLAKEEKIKIQLAAVIQKAFQELNHQSQDNINETSLKSVMDRIPLIKKANGDFELYLQKLYKKYNYNKNDQSYEDIDAMLDDILKRRENGGN